MSSEVVFDLITFWDFCQECFPSAEQKCVEVQASNMSCLQVKIINQVYYFEGEQTQVFF